MRDEESINAYNKCVYGCIQCTTGRQETGKQKGGRTCLGKLEEDTFFVVAPETFMVFRGLKLCSYGDGGNVVVHSSDGGGGCTDRQRASGAGRPAGWPAQIFTRRRSLRDLVGNKRRPQSFPWPARQPVREKNARCRLARASGQASATT